MANDLPEDPAPQATPPVPDQAPATPVTPAPPAERPRPAFGELAPEGWSWKPEGAAAESAAQSGQAPAGATGAGQASASPSGSLPGVPHNLGAGVNKGSVAKGSGAQAPQRTAPSQEGSGAPYRAQTPNNPSQPAPQQLGGPTGVPGGAPKQRTADRVISIVLLALGALSTLYMASSFFALETQINLTGVMIGLDETTVAPWVGTLGTATGFVVLALFALTLIYSIRRMRARQLTFWVPLVAGVIAIILVVVIPAIALVSGAPEIMEQLNQDPYGSMDKMMEYTQQLQ